MATCPRCGNFFIGSECSFCRVEMMKNPELKKKVDEEQEHRKRVEEFGKQWENNFLVVTTPLLDGYKIERYLGAVTGSTVMGTGFLSEFKAGFSDLFGSQSNAFSDKLELAKKAALEKAKKNALALEANALIGVDIDFQMFFGNMVAAIVSGTAVYLIKE